MSMSVNSVGASALAETFAQLSTGRRANSADDDPAGLAVAEALSTRASSEAQAVRNINDGISTAQLTDSALDDVADALTRMRELAVQASSETMSGSGRDAIQAEVEQLADEVDRVAESTEFNGIGLTDGSRDTLDVQVGPDAGDTVTMVLSDLHADTLGVDPGSLDLSSAAGAQSAIGAIDNALEQVGEARSSTGATERRLGSSLDMMVTEEQSLSSASSSIQDADWAEALTNLAQQQIMQSVDIAIQAQTNLARSPMLQLLV